MGGDFKDQLAAGLQAFQQRFAQSGGGTTSTPAAQNPAVQRIQQAAQNVITAPVPQDIQFPVPVSVPPQTAAPATPQAAAQPAQQAAQGAGPDGAQPVESVVPMQPGMAVVDIAQQREASDQEILERVRNISATELAFGAAEPDQAANVQLGALRQQEAELSAKTIQQAEVNKLILGLLGTGDSKEIATGKAGLGLRSATVNPATGNISFNLGLPTSEERRTAQRSELQAAIIDDLQTGNRTPLQTVLALQARGDNPLTLPPEEISSSLENLAGQLIALRLQAGGEIGAAVEEAFRLTGQIPSSVEEFLPAQASNEARLTRSREIGKLQSQLSDPAAQVRNIESSVAAQRQITKNIIDFRSIQKPTTEQGKTRRSYLEAADSMEQLNTLFKSAFVGPIRGRVGATILDISQTLRKGEAKFRTLLKQLETSTVLAATGAAMSQKEMPRILATIPTVNDTPNVFLEKLQANAEVRMRMLRIFEANVEQGGRRFRGDITTKDIDIGGNNVTVIDIDKTTRLLDPAQDLEFDPVTEAKAGIVALRDGTVVQMNPETGEVTGAETAGSDTAPGLDPAQNAAAASPGTDGTVSADAQEFMQAFQEAIRQRSQR